MFTVYIKKEKHIPFLFVCASKCFMSEVACLIQQNVQNYSMSQLRARYRRLVSYEQEQHTISVLPSSEGSEETVVIMFEFVRGCTQVFAEYLT